jgi:HD-GYP domain-containing protein (c-di-GMP phosphodiesterase class II)
MKDAGSANRVGEVLLKAIRVFTEILEIRSAATAAHCRRVADIAAAVAEQMGLPQANIGRLRLAGGLHDIGKIGVRDSVLLKDGALTDEEYQHMMTHADLGRRILVPLFGDVPLVDAVRHHHERFDGTGMPDGLHGEQIPLDARVLALADAVEAMTHTRRFRAALPARHVLEEVKSHSGTQFDPAVVEAFLRTRQAKALAAVEEHQPAEASTAALDECSSYVRAEDLAAAPPTAPEQLPSEPLVSRAAVIEAVTAAKSVKALPFVTAEILRLTGQRDSDMAALISTLLRDPGLVAKVLRLANTSFYAAKGRVQSVERAVVLIGYAGIRELAAAAGLVDLMDKRKTSSAVNRVSLWRHQVACAALARSLARASAQVSPEEAFVDGLLHDLGIGVLDDLFPEAYAAATAYAAKARVRLAEAERAFLGIDHGEVAGELCKAWNIDARFRMPMVCHHRSWSHLARLAASEMPAAVIVKAADILATSLGEGYPCDAFLEDIPRAVLAKLSLDRDKIADAIARMPQDIADLHAVFLMNDMPTDMVTSRLEPLAVGKAPHVLFLGADDRPIDPFREYLNARQVPTLIAREVGDARPDLVALRGGEEAGLVFSLQAMAKAYTRVGSDVPRVIVLGQKSLSDQAKRLYPEDFVTCIEEPCSLSAVDEAILAVARN